MSRLTVPLAILMLTGIARAEEDPAAKVLARFETLAKELPFLARSDFIRGRAITVPMKRERKRAYDDLVHAYTFGRYEPETLLPLCKHEDPKIRTLAIMGLFARHDPLLLPHLFPLSNDDAETFPLPVATEIYTPGGWPRYGEPEMRPQTVGDIAIRMLEFYGQRSHGSQIWWQDPVQREIRFEIWFGPRAKRGHCMGWRATHLARLTHDVRPEGSGAELSVSLLFHEWERELPPVDAALTVLMLGSHEYILPILGERRLIYAARRLGHDRLLALLADEPITDDPDVGRGAGPPWKYNSMCAFLLRHARELLRPSDAEAILAMPQAKRSPLYSVAAAELAPERGREILHAAIGRFTERHHDWEKADLVITLARHWPEEEREFLVEWFYDVVPDPSSPAGYRSRLPEFLLDRFSPADRAILADLVRDRRFLTLDCHCLQEIGRGLDRNHLERFFTEDDFREAWHPFSVGGVYPELERAMEEFPKETSDFLRVLADWRRRIRATLPLWEP